MDYSKLSDDELKQLHAAESSIADRNHVMQLAVKV